MSIDRIYGAPLDEFTPTRDAIVKEVRAAGDKAGAATIKALRKPTTAAWAVNQLSRRQRKTLDSLFEVGDRLRKAQRAALSGRGGRELRDVSMERRKVLDELTKKAVTLLGPSGEAQRDAVRATLEAALASDDAAELVRKGRLVKDLEAPSGFGDVSGLELLADIEPDGTPSARDRRRAARAARRTSEPGGTDDGAHEDGHANTLRRSDLQRVIEDKGAALEKAVEEAHAAAREAAAARAEVSRLQDELVTANGRAKAAAERARLAEWAHSQAQQEVNEAERALRDLV